MLLQLVLAIQLGRGEQGTGIGGTPKPRKSAKVPWMVGAEGISPSTPKPVEDTPTVRLPGIEKGDRHNPHKPGPMQKNGEQVEVIFPEDPEDLNGKTGKDVPFCRICLNRLNWNRGLVWYEFGERTGW